MIKVGTKVRIKKGAGVPGGQLFWCKTMDRFVGEVTVVTKNGEEDDAGVIYDLDPNLTGTYGFYEEWLEVVE